jgi:tetratricopeptide (TPR) repeat protein
LPDALLSCAAARLFAERAAEIEPAFRVVPENAAAVARICRRLDGIPLALELAAAQLNALTVDQIADRLDDRFRLLTDASRTDLPRHQTLRAAMDWSHDLLSDGERTVLRRASVFAGGFALEAAAAVCAEDGVAADEIGPLVGRLVNKSLLLAERPLDEPRFRLQETVRWYGRDRLLEEGERARACARHRDWYLALAERSEAELQGADQQRWIARLEREHDNLREAIAFSLDEPSGSEAVRLVAALWWFWHTRGYLTEGRSWLARAIGAGPTDNPRARARALYGAGFLAWRQGEFDQAQAFGRESLNIARALGNALGMAAATSLLEQVARSQGHYARAAALPEQNLAMFRELGDTWGIATALISVGNAARFQGNHGRAREALEESLGLFRSANDPSGTAAALHFLALVARDQGDYARAEAAGQESLDLNRRLGDASRVAFSLHVLGLVARDQGRSALAEALLEESLGIFRNLEDTWGVTTALVSLGVAARLRGAHVQAAALLQEGLSLRKRLGDKVGIAECLEDLAAVAVGDSPERAVRLLGAGEALRGSMGAQLPPAHRTDCERAAEIALARLGREAFEQEWSAGRRMDAERAVEDALALTIPDRAGGPELADRQS